MYAIAPAIPPRAVNLALILVSDLNTNMISPTCNFTTFDAAMKQVVNKVD
jgi:hypothetical protein